MKKNIPTIRDVAAAAGVSTATVSKYINGAQRFSPPVEATIKAVIEDLGYYSNPLAQSMITGRTKTIGLAVLDISNPHFTSIVKGANRVAVEHDYTVLLVDTEESPHREMQLLQALSRRVDGMIVSSRIPDQAIEWMVKIGKPVVFFGRLAQFDLPSVGTDGFRGAQMLAQHLVTSGHRKIAYLGYGKSRWNEERLRGIKETMAAHELSVTVYDTDAPSAAEGERMCSSIMLQHDHPDALICYNDMIALGFMKEAQTLGFRLPADISVTGFDNIQFGRYTFPPLTTVDLQSERMGEEATRQLFAVLADNPKNDFTMLEPRLVLRASTKNRN